VLAYVVMVAAGVMVFGLLLARTSSALAAEYSVNSTADPGTGGCDATECTLREAIAAADADATADDIKFAIAGAGTHTITPASSLPAIDHPVAIDGTTQPGYSGTPLIEVSGAGGDATVGPFDCFYVTAASTTVRGLAINDCRGSAIRLLGSGGHVEADRIGTNVAGDAARPNVGGVTVIGTSGAVIGGTASGAGNVISGNTSSGVEVIESNGTTIAGNRIGTNASGTAKIGNAWGVLVSGASGDTVVGGSTASARNVISGNSHEGIWFSLAAPGSGHGDNLVQGNYVGVAADGSTDLGNGDNASQNGVRLSGTTHVTIGGTSSGTGNVLSGNGGGVAIQRDVVNGVAATSNKVQGNYIGVAADGATAVPNDLTNVDISNTGTDGQNLIGGTAAGAGNVIANTSSGPGVNVSGGAGNTIEGNAIHDNNFIGIDLGADGVTSNDAGDGDSGANNLQNYPMLTAANGASVAGSLNSLPSRTYRIEFFANSSCDTFGNGEGARYLGSKDVTTDPAGDANFAATLGTAATPGDVFTATATGLTTGDTSEFSPCRGQAPSGGVVTNTADSGPGSLRAAIDYVNVTTGATAITFNIPGSGAHTISPASPLPAITRAVMVDGSSQPGFSGKPLIVLDGSSRQSGGTGLSLQANGVKVKGLEVVRWTKGIQLLGHANSTIVGSYVGTDGGLSQALANTTGIAIEDGASHTIGGTTPADRNVIATNVSGVDISGAAARGNVVEGNYLGTNSAGTASPGSFDGITVRSGASSNIIGGTSQGARNVISGHHYGVHLFGTSSNRVESNYIGTSAAGTAAPSDRVYNTEGVEVDSGATSNVVGGTTPATQNVISNNNFGVEIAGLGTNGNTVAGNYVGLDASGLQPTPNGTGIVVTLGASRNLIGGDTQGARNVISGNRAEGIYIATSGTSANKVQGNYIGTSAVGSAAVPNAQGILILGRASGNTIGGMGSGEGNLITGNAIGIQVTGSSTNGNALLGNSIFANGSPPAGIVLANGGNRSQPAPTITSIATSGGRATIAGTAPTGTRVELFANADCLDPEGKRLLGSVATTTGAWQLATSTLAAGEGVTATGTDNTSRDTSAFSGCAALPSSPNATLRGASKRRARFTANIHTSRGASPVKELKLTPPPGFGFNKRNLTKGITLSKGPARMRYRAAVHGRQLSLIPKKPATDFTVRLAYPALTVTATEASKVRKHKVKKVNITLTLTSTSRKRATLKLRVPVT
jgi:CSLREA domain-containing protein